MTLQEFIADPKTGRPKRGSISRVAEHLGVQWKTVAKWISGEWQPGIATAIEIQDMIRARISLEPRTRRDGGLPRSIGSCNYCGAERPNVRLCQFKECPYEKRPKKRKSLANLKLSDKLSAK